MFLWLCYHSSKLNLTTVRKSPENELVVRFLIGWILKTENVVLLLFQFELKMAVHATSTKKKFCKVNNFWYFLRVNFLLMYFQEELASFLSAQKPVMVTSHGDPDFSKLVNLCPVKTFSLISTPGRLSWKLK